MVLGSWRSRNGVGNLVGRELREQVGEDRRVNDRMIAINNSTSTRINMVPHEALKSPNAEKAKHL